MVGLVQRFISQSKNISVGWALGPAVGIVAAAGPMRIISGATRSGSGTSATYRAKTLSFVAIGLVLNRRHQWFHRLKWLFVLLNVIRSKVDYYRELFASVGGVSVVAAAEGGGS